MNKKDDFTAENYKDLEIDLSVFGDVSRPEPDPETIETDGPTVKAIHRYGHRHISRKLRSEAALADELPWHFQEGDCYHVFSFGDVDSLTYFKHVLHQEKIKYAAISTWCMAGEDIDDLEKWHAAGMIDRVDFYFGEIFQGSYSVIYEKALAFSKKCGGRCVIFRNHSKVMIKKGERFDCLIESSANVNTNPRCENTVLTVDGELVNFYIQLFNGIKSFNHDADGVPIYEG